MIGDKETDLLAAKNASIKGFYLKVGIYQLKLVKF